jgi:hypothetical protein
VPWLQSLSLAVEGPLPAYATTIGEVEEVKREKDAFFQRLLSHTREQAEAAGVLEVQLHPGRAAELVRLTGSRRQKR